MTTETDPLARLDERLARIEARLDRLTSLLDHAPGVIAMAADSADEWARGAVDRGVDLDGRAKGVLKLAEQVTEPDRLASMERVSRRVADLEPLVELAAAFEPTVAMAADSFDAWAASQVARGVDLDQRGRDTLELVWRLSDPEVSCRMNRLLDLLPKLLPVAELASTFEPTTAMLFDMFDEYVRELVDSGVDAENRFLNVARLLRRLTDPEFDRHLHELLDAAPSLMAATRTGELFGRAVDKVTADGAQPIGAFGLLGALGRPEVQRTLGFAIAVAEHVGRTLPAPTVPTTR